MKRVYLLSIRVHTTHLSLSHPFQPNQHFNKITVRLRAVEERGHQVEIEEIQVKILSVLAAAMKR